MSTSWPARLWRAIIPAPDPLPPEDTADRAVRRWRRLLHIGSWLVAGYLFLYFGSGEIYRVSIEGSATGTKLATSVVDPVIRLILAAFAAAPVVLCRWRPMLAWLSWLVALAIVWTFVLVFPPTLYAVLALVSYTVGLRYPARAVALVWVVSTVLTTGFGVVRNDLGYGLNAGVLALAAAVVGNSVRARRVARDRLLEQQRESAEQQGRVRLLEERARIARDLHDVVAHHMSLIVVQASSAPARLRTLPAEAGAEFAAIGDSARESLAEMRRMLSVLRGADSGGDAPGLDGLESLVDSVRSAGTPVTLEIEGSPADLPSTVGVTAYRIVQEALSNVIRHASGSATGVEIRHTAATLRVRVHNAGPPPERRGVAETGGTGHGLAGMRERVVLLGGELVTGPDGDGFTVEARIPLA